MFLSIIIPHYNLPHELLKRCIGSILAQDIASQGVEVIIVDDGSPAPPVWVNGLCPDCNIKLIEAVHEGLGAARNKGLEAATGEYILFLDSDDYLQPGSLAHCMEIINEEHPQILRFRQRKTYGKEKTVTHKPEYSQTISGAAFMAANNLPGSACAYMFSRKLANKFNLRFRCGTYHEDEEFTTRIHYHAQSLISCNILVYNYYTRPESITQSKASEIVEKRVNDYLAILENIKTFNKEQQPTANPVQKRGIERKQAFLTVDTIINLFRMGKSAAWIHTLCNSKLRSMELYPLPKAKYSIKYRCFRFFANHKAGLYLLKTILH